MSRKDILKSKRICFCISESIIFSVQVLLDNYLNQFVIFVVDVNMCIFILFKTRLTHHRLRITT